ncbi:MAG: hypothetical protein U0572_17155 [Phycisphaerales bacterium]
MRVSLFAQLIVVAFALVVNARGLAEIVQLPRFALQEHATAIVVGKCLKVESTVERDGDVERTEWAHRLQVESAERDGQSAIKVGDEIVVLSWTAKWVGAGDPPPFGTGHRGMPELGERRRVFIGGSIAQAAQERRDKKLDALRLTAMLPNGWQPVERNVVLVGADDEYRSEVSMPLVADCLAHDATVKTVVAFPADPATKQLDLERRDHIERLAALGDADAAVLFMRWRELDAANWSIFRDYLLSGQPLVGLRTSTHMLRSSAKDPNADLDVELPTRLFGTHWISHAGNATGTRVLPPEGDAARHPILRGIRGGFVVPSWLYDVEPLSPDCKVLLWGEVVSKDGSTPATHRQPILWIREANASTPLPLPGAGRPARRMAFTTLGHPGDFANVEVRRLVEQMTLWAMGDEASIPAEGVKAEPSAPYAAPSTR